jgi:malonyl-CoA/methylmalonyl-CoA synthetase
MHCICIAHCRYVDILSLALSACQQLDGRPRDDGGSSTSVRSAAAAAVGAAADGPRVALMSDPGAAYVAGTFAAWLHRGIAVPLCLTHPDRQVHVGMRACNRSIRACHLAIMPLPLD